MILDEIILHNFGAFRGRQKAALSPASPDKPIVLFGGLNGGGKTTLMEGLQLALYGKFAAGSRQNGHGYEDYLKRCIHRSINPRDGASVEVAFRSTTDGNEHEYRVRRSWSAPNGRVNEHLDVSVNGSSDSVLGETWAEQVERFIPARLSYLFFFDGERIEALADPDQSSSMLSTGIYALLGVDILTLLQSDVTVLERRRRKGSMSTTQQVDIVPLETELKAVQDKLAELSQELGGLRNECDRANKYLKEAENQFTQQGGGLVERRRELEQQQANLRGQLEAVRDALVVAASGSLPLALVRSQLKEVAQQCERENAAQKAEVLCTSLFHRDESLLKTIRQAGAGRKVIAAADAYLCEDRRLLDQARNVTLYLGLDAAEQAQLATLRESRLTDVRQQAASLVQQAHHLDSQLEAMDRKLASVPDEAAVSKLLAGREQARHLHDECQRRFEATAKLISEMKKREQDLTHRLEDTLKVQQQVAFDNQDTERFLNHTRRVRDTLDRFRIALLSRHTHQLAELILDGFRQLLRKQSLVAEIQIDPETSALRLLGSDGRPLPAERLSAGERQLLAVAMLWGLGRASGRPLPAVIDTPLGRLDSFHRVHLVERYFPRASHQVILLSTDEEIDERHYEMLRPRIARSYRLEHNDSTMATSIEPGYFW